MHDGSVDVAALDRWIRGFAERVAANRDLLTQLDSAIGDADHGANMDRGMAAVVAALDGKPPATAAALLKQVGMTLVSTVGGASGPLYGTFFLRMATAAGEVDALDAEAFAKALRAGLDGVVARGKAEAGDKTMFDALAPAVEALDTALAGGRTAGRRLARHGGRRRGGPRRDHPDARPQGPRELPRRAQRRAPGPGRDLGGPAHARRPPPRWARAPDAPADASAGLGGRRLAQPGARPTRRSRWPGRCCTASRCAIEVAAGLDDTTFGTDADPDR